MARAKHIPTHPGELCSPSLLTVARSGGLELPQEKPVHNGITEAARIAVLHHQCHRGRLCMHKRNAKGQTEQGSRGCGKEYV